MSEPVRLAGRGRLRDGGLVTWTVAEGRQGRRWRESVTDGTALRWSLLYETDPAGRFTHLELASPVGLATLHPDGDATLHGNVVRSDQGVRHVVGVPMQAGGALLVAGSLVSGAAVAGSHSIGGVAVVLDPATLVLSSRELTASDLVTIDGRGVPVGADITTWPLET